MSCFVNERTSGRSHDSYTLWVGSNDELNPALDAGTSLQLHGESNRQDRNACPRSFMKGELLCTNRRILPLTCHPSRLL